MPYEFRKKDAILIGNSRIVAKDLTFQINAGYATLSSKFPDNTKPVRNNNRKHDTVFNIVC